MATSTQYNLKSPAVKRILKEANELKNPTEDYFAQPLEENIFEWHFTIRGPKESCFCDGIYHGRLLLPTEYPLKPPSIFLITPNGRFQTNKKICLSISSHHPETWIPSWSIRTILLALISFMPSESLGTIGSLDYSSEERKELAKKSIDWSCNVCGKINDLLKERNESIENENLEENDKELLKMINFKGDVDQQSTPAGGVVDKVVTKIDAQDNEIDPQNIQNVSNQNEDRNVSNDGNQVNNLNRTDQQLSRIRNHNNNGILPRISPMLICFLILVIILKRIYLTFF